MAILTDGVIMEGIAHYFLVSREVRGDFNIHSLLEMEERLIKADYKRHYVIYSSQFGSTEIKILKK